MSNRGKARIVYWSDTSSLYSTSHKFCVTPNNSGESLHDPRGQADTMPFNDLIRQRMQPLANVVTAQRFSLYALASTIAVVAVIANACRNYSNFYSIAVYLGRSGRSVLVRSCSYHISAQPDPDRPVPGQLLRGVGSCEWQDVTEDLLWTTATA